MIRLIQVRITHHSSLDNERLGGSLAPPSCMLECGMTAFSRGRTTATSREERDCPFRYRCRKALRSIFAPGFWFIDFALRAARACAALNSCGIYNDAVPEAGAPIRGRSSHAFRGVRRNVSHGRTRTAVWSRRRYGRCWLSALKAAGDCRTPKPRGHSDALDRAKRPGGAFALATAARGAVPLHRFGSRRATATLRSRCDDASRVCPSSCAAA